MKFTTEFLQEKDIKCSECLHDKFEIIENGDKLKCKNCGKESAELDTSLGDLISMMNNFVNLSPQEQQKVLDKIK